VKGMPGEITQFEWDENKRRQNLAKHGVDFLRAALVFDGRPAVMLYSPRAGEDRWQTTAAIEGRLITVIWTWRDERCRIISARRARDGEERAYRQTYA
jgi:uncharacterized DUF497 family protein